MLTVGILYTKEGLIIAHLGLNLGLIESIGDKTLVAIESSRAPEPWLFAMYCT